MVKLNEQANGIRNIKFSEDRAMDFEIKKEMIDVLKEKTDYQKDEVSQQEKRERRSKIRDLA
jgi:molybdopterin synthase catalytic subunit